MKLSKATRLQLERYNEIIQDESCSEVLERLRTKLFSPKTLGISYRELNHWSSKGLLFEDNKFGKMRQFNLLELVWIEVIKELRLYNFQLKTIAILKENLQLNISARELFEDHEEAIIEIMDLQFRGKMTAEEHEEFLKSDFYSEAISQSINSLENVQLNLFEIILFDVYFLKFDHKLIVNYEGYYSVDNELFKDNFLSIYNSEMPFGSSYILISLGAIISRIFEDFSTQDLELKWRLINEKERQILDILQKSSQIKSLTIRFNEKNEANLLEYIESLDISPQKTLKHILISGAYQEIILKTQNGHVVRSERTTKIKI